MAELTKKYRPKCFSEVIGQPLATKILKEVVKDAENTPKSLILSGEYGTGKTSLARIFSRALSCEKFKDIGKICFKCEGCLKWGDVSNRYIEYDSSMVGNVQQIKELRPLFEMYTDYYRVITLDEAQLISRQAQAALLKVLEEGNPKTFFVLCSTDPQAILKTIHSRSTPVDFYSVDQNVMSDYLIDVYKKEKNEDLSKQVSDKIAFKADGHVRDGIKLLELYMLNKDEEILNIPLNAIALFFIFLGEGKKEEAEKQISKIIKYPLVQIQRTLNYVIMKSVECHVMKQDNIYKNITDLFKDNIINIFKLISELWVQGVFKEKNLTISFFYTILRMYSK